MVISIDYARLFYFGVTVQNCARNGAYYASNYPNNSYLYNDIYGYKSVDEAILSDAANLTPIPTYEVRYGPSAEGPFTLSQKPSGDCHVQVTVRWTFHSITNFPGVPTTVNLERVAIMQVAPAMPEFPGS
jgi:hypothetical protein